MIKYRLKRVKRYNHDGEENELDDHFVEGSLNGFPEIGESLVFNFSRPDKGTWITSSVLRFDASPTKNFIVIHTKNSVYNLKKDGNRRVK